MNNNTMVFTTTDIVRRSRKLGRTVEPIASYINELSEERFQNFTKELDHLSKTFFNVAKMQPNPEQEFIRLCNNGSIIEGEPYKEICILMGMAAKELVKEKYDELHSIMEGEPNEG